MLSEREAAVERVLSDLRALLNGRADAACPCEKGEKYRVRAGECLVRLAEARTFAELAVSSADRALDAIEAVTGAVRASEITTRPL